MKKTLSTPARIFIESLTDKDVQDLMLCHSSLSQYNTALIYEDHLHVRRFGEIIGRYSAEVRKEFEAKG